MSPRTLNLSEPWYIIAFSRSERQIPYRAVLPADDTIRQFLSGEVSIPLGFDRALIPALPAVWYCLHLPRSRFDFRSLPAKALKEFQRLHNPHKVILLPVPWRMKLPELVDNPFPKILLTPSELRSETELVAQRLRNVVDVSNIETLDTSSLARHWNALRIALKTGAERFIRPATLTPNTTLGPSFLAMLWASVDTQNRP